MVVYKKTNATIKILIIAMPIIQINEFFLVIANIVVLPAKIRQKMHQKINTALFAALFVN